MRTIAVLVMMILIHACSESPPPPCGGSMLSPLTVMEGGRVEIALDPSLTTDLVAVTATEGLEAWREASNLVVRSGYEATQGVVTLSCMTGRLDVPVNIEPLAMTPVLEWDASVVGAPPAREYFAWWIDPRDTDSLYLYGGFVYQPTQFTPSTEAFRLALTTLVWSPVITNGAQPPPGGRVGSTEEGALYFGGTAPTASGQLDTPPILRRFRSDGGALQIDSAEFEPTAIGSYTGAFVRDETRARWLSICGIDTRVLGLHCRVHTYTPDAGFAELDVAGEPPTGRFGFHYAFDYASDRVIVFGGQVGFGNLDLGGDTWALELSPERGGPRWTRLFEAVDGILPRRNGAYAMDPWGRRLFVWGGTSDGRTAVAGLDVLELDPGRERWVHLDLPETVPSRVSGAGVLDAERTRILWGFGNADRLYTDLYSLSLTPRNEI